MKPNQLWLDFSQKNAMRVWVDAKLQLAQATSTPQQRLGFFREIPIYHLNPESAKNLGWTSFSWDSMEGKFHLEKDFWIAAHWDWFLAAISLASPKERQNDVRIQIPSSKSKKR